MAVVSARLGHAAVAFTRRTRASQTQHSLREVPF